MTTYKGQRTLAHHRNTGVSPGQEESAPDKDLRGWKQGSSSNNAETWIKLVLYVYNP